MSRKKKDAVLVSQKYDKKSTIGEIWGRIRTNPGAVTGIVLLCILFLTMIVGVFVIDYASVVKMDPAHSFQSPNAQHIFGTDEMGRDLFIRVIYGLRYSYMLAIGAVAIAFVFGSFLGSLAGYFQGKVETVIMRITDMISSIPTILLGMVIVSVLGSSIINLMLAIAFTASPQFIRMSRASVLTVRNNEYIESASAIGMSPVRIIITQAFPNAVSPLIVALTSRIGSAILEIASLSFLGFGVKVPLPELGSLVSSGRNFIVQAPFLTLIPGIFIFLTTFSFAQLGDGLRDALDPRLKK